MQTQTRQLLFLLGCLPLRTLLIWVVYKRQINKIVVGTLACAIALGFLFQHFRGNNVGAFGGTVYWNRLVHAFFYVICGILYALNWPGAWVPLLCDLLFGLVTFLRNFSF